MISSSRRGPKVATRPRKGGSRWLHSRLLPAQVVRGPSAHDVHFDYRCDRAARCSVFGASGSTLAGLVAHLSLQLRRVSPPVVFDASSRRARLWLFLRGTKRLVDSEHAYAQLVRDAPSDPLELDACLLPDLYRLEVSFSSWPFTDPAYEVAESSALAAYDASRREDVDAARRAWRNAPDEEDSDDDILNYDLAGRRRPPFAGP